MKHQQNDLTNMLHRPVESATYTWETFGYVSAAEGFVFLSGYMAGLVYGKYAMRDPALFAQRAFGSAWTIYRFHVVLLIAVCLFTVFSHSLSADWRSHATLFMQQPVEGLVLGFVLLYQPPLLDILPMYTIFLLITPLMIRCFQNRKTYLVFLVSVGLWMLAQIEVREFILLSTSISIVDLGLFDIFAWQFLFVVGVWFGCTGLSCDLTVVFEKRWIMWLVFPIAIMLFLMRHEYISAQAWGLAEDSDRDSLAWLRLLNVACAAYLIAWLLQHKQQLVRYTRWFGFFSKWLAFLGQHSLQVLSYQVLIFYLLIPLEWSIQRMDDPIRTTLEVAVCLVAIASLTIPATIHRTYHTSVRLPTIIRTAILRK